MNQDVEVLTREEFNAWLDAQSIAFQAVTRCLIGSLTRAGYTMQVASLAVYNMVRTVEAEDAQGMVRH